MFHLLSLFLHTYAVKLQHENEITTELQNIEIQSNEHVNLQVQFDIHYNITVLNL